MEEDNVQTEAASKGCKGLVFHLPSARKALLPGQEVCLPLLYVTSSGEKRSHSSFDVASALCFPSFAGCSIALEGRLWANGPSFYLKASASTCASTRQPPTSYGQSNLSTGVWRASSAKKSNLPLDFRPSITFCTYLLRVDEEESWWGMRLLSSAMQV